jgi:hypothetical protein
MAVLLLDPALWPLQTSTHLHEMIYMPGYLEAGRLGRDTAVRRFSGQVNKYLDVFWSHFDSAQLVRLEVFSTKGGQAVVVWQTRPPYIYYMAYRTNRKSASD